MGCRRTNTGRYPGACPRVGGGLTDTLQNGGRAHRGGFRIGIDTGGTFTDVVVGDETGILSVGNALTSRERISRGILEGLAVAAAPLGIELRALLEQTAVFIYGSTRATNAILEGKTARTTLLTTAGFPDTLVRREGGKTNPWDYSRDYPDPYVPRHLTFEIAERITSAGAVYQPLDEAAAREVLDRLRALRVEAVAVSFLWSIANPAHELRMGRLIEEKLPGIPYTLSHLVNPILREYRRTSCAAIDASLKPLMQAHLRAMEADLRDAGLGGELLPAVSLGGVMHIEDVIAKPIHMVRSGPSLAPLLGQAVGAAEAGASEVIICDTGGTSFDVSLVRGGRPVFSRDTWLGPRYTGHLTGLSSVDARSIGAGGGSIAGIDSGGLLCVGPESAGADPGPACYGKGGERPTLTDACLLIGILDPHRFACGQMMLQPELARAAFDRLDCHLSLEQRVGCAWSMGLNNIAEGLIDIAIKHGVDPRDYTLIAYGAAGPMLLPSIMDLVHVRRVVIPPHPGLFSALGLLSSDLVYADSRSAYTVLGPEAAETIDRVYRAMEESLLSRIRADRRQVEVVRSFDGRLLGQTWETPFVDVPAGPITPATIARMVANFHEVYERRTGNRFEAIPVQGVTYRVQVVVPSSKVGYAPIGERNGQAMASGRPVRLRYLSDGELMAREYRRDDLRRGDRIEGPAVIREAMSTTFVPLDHRASVGTYGEIVVERA